MDKAPTSNRYGDIENDWQPALRMSANDSISAEEMRAHMKRVETLTVVLRDVLLAMADVPPFSMMVSAEQKRMLQEL